MKRFSLLCAFFALLFATPVLSATLEERLERQPESFTRDQLIGRWRLVAQRIENEDFQKPKKQSYIYLVTPENARSDEIELHSDARKWLTERVNVPANGPISARFEYYPEAREIASAVPSEIRPELEGILKWTADLTVHASAGAPILKVTFHPGEVRWDYDRISGEITSHTVQGPGEAREFIYTYDPALSISRSPTQRVEVLSFLGAEAKVPEGATVTPQVLTTIPGQKIYPQAYLDEAVAREKGRRIDLTITGEQSGETVTLQLESRGVAVEGEMRYGLELSRVSHPLGRALTLATNCGANDPYLYPPFLSWQWVNEFLAEDALARTRERGSCVDFDGISGETVRFSIDEDTLYRVQWYARWEEVLLAKYRTQASKMATAIDAISGPDSARLLRMIGRFDSLMESDLLTVQQKTAVGAVYFARPGEEVVPTGLIRISKDGAQKYLENRRKNRLGTLQLANYYGLQDSLIGFDWENRGRPGRDYAATLFGAESKTDPRIILETLALDEAIMVGAARQLSVVADSFVTDGFRTMVNLFQSVNLGGKVFSMFEGVDAFGNPMSDEAYWLNVLDIAAEFTMLGASLYEASGPLRFHKTGANGKIAQLSDGIGGAPATTFKARMQGSSAPELQHFSLRSPSGQNQIANAFDVLSDGFPNSIRPSQRPQIVVNAAPASGPAYRLLPEPQNPIVPARVTSIRRPTQIVKPADPIMEFGTTARIAQEAPAQFRASTPNAPDAVAGNFIMMRQTGRSLTEAQGRAQLVMAMESLSNGQSALTSGVLSFGQSEPVPNSIFTHRLEMQGIEVAHFRPDSLNMATAKTAVDGGWTVAVKIKPNGGSQRRVILTKVGDDQWGIGAAVDFFDPTRGQVIRMDVDDFADMVVLDADTPVSTYRARDPMVDARRTEPVAFPAAKLPEPEPQPVALPASVDPKANSYFRLQTEKGEQVIALGEKVGDGLINGVFRAAGRDGQVVRISLNKDGNINQVLNDWFGRSFLARDGIDPDVIAPIKLHQRRIVAEGPNQLQVLEIVDEFSGTLADKLVKQQGGQMTQGQANAYVAAAREINKQGAIWMDGHLNNFTFIQTGDDAWKVQIFDPGGIYPVRGESAAARAASAREIQTNAWAPEDIYLQKFAGDPSTVKEGFRADIFNKYRNNIATEAMEIPEVSFFEFDMDLGVTGNLEVSFLQPKVRAAVKQTQR